MGTLNKGRGGVVGTGQYVGRTKWARAYYDFATDGGDEGAITLRGDKIPSGAVVLDTIIDVTDPVTSGGAATVSLGINSATDVRAAATLSTAPSLAAAATPHGAVTRATAALPSFQLTAANAPTVAGVCWQVAGLPLPVAGPTTGSRATVPRPANRNRTADPNFRRGSIRSHPSRSCRKPWPNATSSASLAS